MKDKIDNIKESLLREIASVSDIAQAEAVRVKHLGRKGVIQDLLKELPYLSAFDKALYGRMLNDLKRETQELIDKRLQELKAFVREDAAIDKTLPGSYLERGHTHPITAITDEIYDIFCGMGFDIAESPEIETEYYNFQALNIPVDHPSRDAFDTFYLKGAANGAKFLLRSQTSTVQLRVMEKTKPPLRVIHAGRVYRPDATDASHSFMFNQIEGFMVDEGISFSNLKGILSLFVDKFFGSDVKTRFRPHYFPFTEPSAEVDISCIICKGKGCRVCSKKGWLEVLGCGMIHPNVFKEAGYDTEKYAGFAFGMGIDRIAMLKYGIDDIRLLFENDLRFLRQF